MPIRMRKLGCAVLLALVSVAVLATTWGLSDIECPLCHTSNKFNVVMSYGTYIYAWPSKFQVIYWPRTDGNVVYTCKKCYLSLFMWDFTEFPQDKADAVRAALSGMKSSHEFKDYTALPMSERLAMAEKVYKVLDKDQDFWCGFYRVQGYHLAAEKKPAEAAAARSKALLLAEKMITDPANAGRLKELLLIRGAMHHFLSDDPAATQDLQTALKASFADKTYSEQENKNANANLDGLIKEYLERIATKTVPKDDGTDVEEAKPPATS
jgi:uncharacterized protein (DUF2225 family)